MSLTWRSIQIDSIGVAIQETISTEIVWFRFRQFQHEIFRERKLFIYALKFY